MKSKIDFKTIFLNIFQGIKISKIDLKITFRNIFRDKKRSFTLGINYAIVTLILVLVFSFTYGIMINIRNNLSASETGHFLLYGFFKNNNKVHVGLKEYEKIMDIIKNAVQEKITYYPRYEIFTRIYYGGYSKSGSITGIDLNFEKDFKYQVPLEKGDWDTFISDKSGIIISKQLAEYFEFTIGDEFLVSVQSVYGAFNTGTFKVAGITSDSGLFGFTKSYGHLDYIKQLTLSPNTDTQQVIIYFENYKESEKKRDILFEAFRKAGYLAEKPRLKSEDGGHMNIKMPDPDILKNDKEHSEMLTILTLNEILTEINNLVKSINTVGVSVAAILMLIIAVSIFVNLRMTINDRMKEIGTMRTIGMSKKNIVKLFVIENTLLSIVFSLLGIVTALIIMIILSKYIAFPNKGMMSIMLNKGHLALIPKFTDILFVFFSIGLFSALFSFIPANYAGKIKPVDALNKVS